jgi:ectonucleotide pyrophosphatase/phosphodiesterase family protein 5
MIRLARFLLALILLPMAALAQPAARPPVILISVDGLRADYLKRGITPQISALAARGVTTSAMHPSFPSLTFPNHYTLVTGMRPDHHGIVDNNMEDAGLGKFSLGNRDAVGNGRWWDGAEPIWVTAEKAGIPTATMFWPGSEAEIRGVRPRQWLPFDGKLPQAARVDQVLAWLSTPALPGLVTLYFDIVDHEGHEFGPDSAQVNTALAEVDSQIGRLVAGLQARGIDANIVLVADHGMAQVADARRVFLDAVLPAGSFHLVVGGAVAGIDPNPGQDATVAAALLAPQPHMQCWRKASIPARLHYGSHPRVPAFVCAAEIGWMIWASPPRPDQKQGPLAGMHGYDPANPEMDAAFVAAGPAFKPGTTLPPFDNVAVQPLLLRLMGLPPMQTDGTLAPLVKALR